MAERIITRAGVKLWSQVSGPDDAPAIVFANSLGTDHSIWDQVITALPDGLRVLRFDNRGHGKSDAPPGPYTMGTLIADAEAILDTHQIRDCVFVGLSIGGMIAQGLAAKRLDQVRAVVLSNTGAKIGTPDSWMERVAKIEAGGIEAIADMVMQVWFSARFRQSDQLAHWRALLLSTPVAGYVGCCHAIAGADLITPTSGLRLPVLAIAGSEDGATPPDLVRETAALIPGSRFHLIRGAGHIPCVEAPGEYARALTAFLKEIGHV